ncbi:hypothetical protein MKZ38_000662 [Zalerion maritima]|uniref:Uncharacterized protein n=1 Tax=Zalerion maritima TaxID=339359 RepID=A0AAD5RSJ6_9PEZI|nr:hypothetical protein MKZ38_000662 [Zalerion maritima]
MAIELSTRSCEKALQDAVESLGTNDSRRSDLYSILTRLRFWAGSVEVFSQGMRSLDVRISEDRGLRQYTSQLLTRLDEQVEEILRPPLETTPDEPVTQATRADEARGDSPTYHSDTSSDLTSVDVDPISKANELLDQLFAVPSMIHHDSAVAESRRVLEFAESQGATIDLSSLERRIREYTEVYCAAAPEYLLSRIVSTSTYRIKMLHFKNSNSQGHLPRDEQGDPNDSLSDLRPYICLFEDCPDGDLLYDTSCDWFNHMKWSHCTFWYCPAQGHEDQYFEVFDQLRRHMSRDHEDGGLIALAKSSRRPHTNPFWCLQMKLGWSCWARPPCPICLWSPENEGESLREHVQNHLEAISSLALPELEKIGIKDPQQSNIPALLQPEQNFLVIGIDFGTTYTGAAWAFRDELREKRPMHVVKQWEGCDGNMVTTNRVPSAISYGSEHTTWGFGVSQHLETTRWMKLFMVNEESLGPQISRSPHLLQEYEKFNRTGKKATEIVSDFLRLLWHHTLDVIQQDSRVSDLQSLHIHVVLTTPAIWKGHVHAALRQAANMAGISGPKDSGRTTIQLLPGPEAAAIELLGSRSEKNLCKVHETFIVCDAGGGSVDVVTYRIENLEPLTLTEAVEGQGDFCGSLFVDSRFSMIHPTLKYLSDEGKEAVSMTKAQIQLLFRDSYGKIMGLISAQIAALQQRGAGTPNGILLVGGLGSSPELFETLRNTYGRQHIRVLQPTNDMQYTAVCRGAVRHGASDRSIFSSPPEFSFGRVVSRIARLSIGHVTSEEFDPKVHDPAHKEWDRFYGRYTVYPIKWYLRRGDRVDPNEPLVERNFWLPVEANCPRMMSLSISHNNDAVPPKYKTVGVKRLSEIKWWLPRPVREYPDWENAEGKIMKKISFHVQVTPIGSAVKVDIIMGNQRIASEEVPLELDQNR